VPDAQVLVVGAGPTGLALALWLRRTLLQGSEKETEE
jgi:2-polyprenyl-6-methoxyphenol hydroxylase-like FAD-dependent oxidoreductase